MIKEFQGEYRWLSNFAPVKVMFMGKEYPSVEHAYMSGKSNDDQWKQMCQDPNNKPGYIKKMSRNIELVPNWDILKKAYMYDCLWTKFNQEPYRQQLIDTGDCEIQEGNVWNDKFWGVCLKTGEGENNLGEMIMRIRRNLQHDR